MKLTDEEQNELYNQLLLVGQLFGVSSRINAPLLQKWLDNGGPQPDFRYEREVRAAIKFREDETAKPYVDKKDYFPFTPKDWPT